MLDNSEQVSVIFVSSVPTVLIRTINFFSFTEMHCDVHGPVYGFMEFGVSNVRTAIAKGT